MAYTSNDNKGLLWGILQESNIFDGINNNDFDKIKNIFEDTIYIINLNRSSESLIDKNKTTIEEMIDKINKQKKFTETSKIKVVYKAEDIKQDRLNEFNTKLQKYQEENSSFGKAIRPEEMKFNDKNDNEDKPIGDEMDRLISERLASRERELEILPISNDAENWINNGRDNSPNVKKVSFKEEPEVENNTKTADVSNILNILKRKTQVTESNDDKTESSELSISRNIEQPILNTGKHDESIILKEIESLKSQQSQIIEMCSKIITILQERNEII